mmetsp:Transcript_79523/g.170443  ORF Transcript_79523/g.170443 Transcript_79523/m.170443 type:complete len:225 (+) Transcript_79523:1042-1716(+)
MQWKRDCLCRPSRIQLCFEMLYRPTYRSLRCLDRLGKTFLIFLCHLDALAESLSPLAGHAGRPLQNLSLAGPGEARSRPTWSIRIGILAIHDHLAPVGKAGRRPLRWALRRRGVAVLYLRVHLVRKGQLAWRCRLFVDICRGCLLSSYPASLHRWRLGHSLKFPPRWWRSSRLRLRLGSGLLLWARGEREAELVLRALLEPPQCLGHEEPLVPKDQPLPQTFRR